MKHQAFLVIFYNEQDVFLQNVFSFFPTKHVTFM